MTITTRSIPLTSQVEFYPTLSCLKSNDSGHTIYLTPSEKKLFEIVLEGQGSKENIIHEIWIKNGTIVGESSYHQLIKNLRRKLKLAGLSCSMIKTIPRYGVIFINYDHDILPVAKADLNPQTEQELEAKEDVSLKQTALEAASVEINDQAGAVVINKPDEEIFIAAGSDVTEVIPEMKSEKADSKIIKIPRKMALLILSCMLFWPLVLICKGPAIANFPFEVTMDNIKFHFLTSEDMMQSNLHAIRQNISGGIKDVYIAGNGPKVWIAKCNKDISKRDSQCQYEYFSSY
ncbi:helix-turn-helix domain-containing protein [Enterobacter asburiae]|uniref:winged helix-turn-helix domain-containing protein n=1 Tax=Scandinavium sp. UTDF21-P1B TaxID=3446379 RepID=UPI0034988E37